MYPLGGGGTSRGAPRQGACDMEATVVAALGEGEAGGGSTSSFFLLRARRGGDTRAGAQGGRAKPAGRPAAAVALARSFNFPPVPSNL